jgi:hypothetical protein
MAEAVVSEMALITHLAPDLNKVMQMMLAAIKLSAS